MDIANELQGLAPLTEREVRRGFMRKEESRYAPNRWWKFEGWVYAHFHWFVAYLLLVEAIGLFVSGQSGFARSIDAIVVLFFFVILPAKVIGFLSKGPPFWCLTNGVHFNMKAERRRLSALHLHLPSHVHVWLEEQVLYKTKHEDEPLAAILWLVMKDERSPTQATRRGMRTWSAVD